MRKLVVSEFLSLDGVMEDPKWTFRFWNDEIGVYKHEELFSADALLLGRVTWEGFAAVWPGRKDDEGYADRMNSLPKFVVSTTLRKADWNNSTIVAGKVAEQIAELKSRPGADILLFGSATLVQTLLLYGLVDQFNLLLYPVVLGKGRRLFQGDMSVPLRLTDTRSFSSGVVALTYRPEEKTGETG